MTERANDSPTACGSADGHGRGAKYFYPQRHGKDRRPQKFEPGREMIEPAGFGAGEKRKRDDAHCFLGVIRAVTVRHPGRAHDLRFSEELMDEMRRQPMKNDEQKKHDESAENKSGDRRGDHRHNYFRPHTGVPFDDRPISFRSGERRAAKTADERVTRARWQTE